MTNIKFITPLLLLSATVYAGEGIYLNLSDQPDRSVRMINSTSTKLIFDIKGDEELIKKNKERGVTLPFKLSNYKSQKISTTSKPAREDGSFKFTRTFEDAASYSENPNGRRVKIPDAMDNMVGLRIEGVIDSTGKMQVNNVSGGNIDSEKKKSLYSMFEQMSNITTTPKHALKIGDHYSTQTPFAMPLPGQQPIQFNNNTKYTLKKVEGNLAIFDVETTFSLSNTSQSAFVNANGSGTGEMKYNIKTKLQEKHTLNMDMEMIVSFGHVELTSTLTSKTRVEQFINN